MIYNYFDQERCCRNSRNLIRSLSANLATQGGSKQLTPSTGCWARHYPGNTRSSEDSNPHPSPVHNIKAAPEYDVPAELISQSAQVQAEDLQTCFPLTGAYNILFITSQLMTKLAQQTHKSISLYLLFTFRDIIYQKGQCFPTNSIITQPSIILAQLRPR